MPEQSAKVHTTLGVVQGFVRDGVSRWRAIPYARPPVGPLRFRAPQPAAPWRGVRYCDEFAYCAPQDPRYARVSLNRVQPMSEDCLTVNVVAPTTPTDEPLPVMFFVHGGGYLFGSSATVIYDGAALARRGCVYVSANYRLGALGCVDLSSLSTDEHPIEGNLFLRDLVLALEWVRDNIAAFGGDPGNVTIFGESAGAHAVATLLAVPAARGLFRRVISESPPTGMFRTADEAGEVAQRFAHQLDTDGDSAAQVIVSARPSQLGRALERLMRDTMHDQPGSFGIGPSTDGDFLPLNPVTAMAQGAAHPVPLIIGNNADEGRLFARFLDHLPTNQSCIERLLADAEPVAREQIRTAYPGYPARAACMTARRGLRLRVDGLADRRGAQCPRAHLSVPLRLCAEDAELGGHRGHACHGTAGGLRRVPQRIRFDAHPGRRPTVGAAGQWRYPAALAGVRGQRCARRRLAANTASRNGLSWCSTAAHGWNSIRCRCGAAPGSTTAWPADPADLGALL